MTERKSGRDLPTLKHYVLVERDVAHIETIDRIGPDWSGFRIADGVTATLDLPGVDIAMPLAEIYADVIAG